MTTFVVVVVLLLLLQVVCLYLCYVWHAKHSTHRQNTLTGNSTSSGPVPRHLLLESDAALPLSGKCHMQMSYGTSVFLLV